MLLYTRAVRRMTWLDWIAASVGGSFPILTRQFGVALVAMLCVLACLGPWTKARLGRYAIGLSLPLLATAWQLNQGWFHPNWAARFVLHGEKQYIWGTGLLKNIPWRPAVATEYAAWMLIPLVVAAAIAAAGEVFQRDDNSLATSHRAALRAPPNHDMVCRFFGPDGVRLEGRRRSTADAFFGGSIRSSLQSGTKGAMGGDGFYDCRCRPVCTHFRRTLRRPGKGSPEPVRSGARFDDSVPARADRGIPPPMG